MRKVLVATPAHSGSVATDYCSSVMLTVLSCAVESIAVEVLMLPHQSLLPVARDALLYEAVQREVDDLVFIDSDMAWDAPDFIRLLKHDVDIVAVPVRKKIPQKTDFNFQLFPGQNKPDENGLLEVSRIGTGLMRISKNVFRRMFDISKKYSVVQNQVYAQVFETGIFNNEMLSEDFVFCEKARQQGFKVYMDTKISCGHIGSFTYVGKADEYLTWLAAEERELDTSKHKVVLGLTTTPPRLSKIYPTILTLLNQTRPADRIVLSLADKIARTGETFGQTPPEIQALIDQGKLEIHRTRDYGPATKFVGMMEVEHDPEAFLIWCDDDMEYNRDMIKSLLTQSIRHPGAAMAMCAFNMVNNDSVYQIVDNNGQEAEILEGFAGVICRRKDMPEIGNWKPTTPDEFEKMDPAAKAYFLGDDCVLSYSLRRKGIKTLASSTHLYNRANGLRMRDVNFGPDALRTNKHTGSNMNSYALIKSRL
jgi:hypothetical protein